MFEAVTILLPSCLAERLKSVLEWMGMARSDLSPEAEHWLQTLAAIAVALDLGDCSDTRCVCVCVSAICSVYILQCKLEHDA